MHNSSDKWQNLFVNTCDCSYNFKFWNKTGYILYHATVLLVGCMVLAFLVLITNTDLGKP